MSVIYRVKEKYREKGFWWLCWRLFTKPLRSASQYIVFSFQMMKHRRILNYLKRRYAYVIEKYKHYAPPPTVRITYSIATV